MASDKQTFWNRSRSLETIKQQTQMEMRCPERTSLHSKLNKHKAKTFLRPHNPQLTIKRQSAESKLQVKKESAGFYFPTFILSNDTPPSIDLSTEMTIRCTAERSEIDFLRWLVHRRHCIQTGCCSRDNVIVDRDGLFLFRAGHITGDEWMLQSFFDVHPGQVVLV